MTFSASQAAEEIDTTPFKLRTFLRASDKYEACGMGKKYSFGDDDIPELRVDFKEWATADQRKRDDRKARIEAERAAKASTPAAEVDDDHTPDEGDVAEMEEAHTIGRAKGSKSVHVLLGDKLSCGRPAPKSFAVDPELDVDAVTCSACKKEI